MPRSGLKIVLIVRTTRNSRNGLAIEMRVSYATSDARVRSGKLDGRKTIMTIRYLICDGALEVPVELAAPADVGQLITYHDRDHVHTYRWIVDAVEHIPYHRDEPDCTTGDFALP